MHVVIAVRVDEDDDLAIQNAERHHPFLAVVCPDVLTRDGEVVPNSVSPLEVQAVKLDVASPLEFVPGEHEHVVITISSEGKPFVATPE
ncbi:MAG: hypothetical protein ABSH28_19375 [Acidobacteriota bacterium]